MRRKLSIAAFSLILAFFVSAHTAQAISLPGGSQAFGGKITYYAPEESCPFFTIKVGPPLKIDQALLVNFGPLEKLFDIVEKIPFIGDIVKWARAAIVPTREFDIKPILPQEWALGITHSTPVSAGITAAINVVGAPIGVHCPDILVVKLIGTSRNPAL